MADSMKNVKMPFGRVFDGFLRKIKKIMIFFKLSSQNLNFSEKKKLVDTKIQKKSNFLKIIGEVKRSLLSQITQGLKL